MRKQTKVLAAIVIMVLILAAGVLLSRQSSRQIRNTILTTKQINLNLSEPMLRGVPVRVHWDVEGANQKNVQIFLRDSVSEKQVGQGIFQDGSIIVSVPCIGFDNGTLVIKNAVNQQVLGTKEVVLLSPGPECLR